jgi:hypothetical protein
MHEVTPLRVLVLGLFYGALVVVMSMHGRRMEPEERKTFLMVGAVWAVSVFIANWLLYKAGVMSFLPWVNNFMHTFVWIGLCLTYLYLGIREQKNLLVQCVIFATFSLVVKYAEQLLFGTWELDHFFHIIQTNWAYVLGWSIADGLYPLLTLYGLRIASRRIPGLVVI